MGYLKNKKCYLIGAIEHDPSFGKGWREIAVEYFNEIGVTSYNPLDRPDWMKHLEDFIPPNISRDEVLERIEAQDQHSQKYIAAQRFIRHICSRFVHSCDFVLCYLPNAKTFGTTEELVIACQAQKPIIMICPDKIPSLWVYDMIKDQPTFDNLQQAMTYFQMIDDGEAELELLKWIFMTDYPNLKLEKQYDW